LTVLDWVEGLRGAAETDQANLLARLEVQNLIREIGLIEKHSDLEDEACPEIKLEMASDVHADKDASYNAQNKRPT
jgi:hypothetical protein